MSSLNAQIREAISAFDVDKARALLRDALKEADAETYYLASQVALNDTQKRDLLQKAIDKDPFHVQAHKASEMLQTGSTAASPPVKASAPAVQPTHESIAPAPQKVETAPQFVTARTKYSTPLYRFPWPNAPMRTTAREGSQVIPVERTESGNWLNVLYVGSTGHEVLGWVEANNLTKSVIAAREVNLMDLPITEFQYNNRQDVIDLSSAISKSHLSFWLSFYCLFVLAFFTVMLWFFESIRTPSGIPLTIILAMLTVIALIWMIRATKAILDQLTFHLGVSWRTLSIYARKLDALRRSKQSVSENMMEDQARIAAMQVAGSLANTYLSKSMTNKSDVTIRYR